MDDYGLLEAIRLSNLAQVRSILKKRTKDVEAARALLFSTLQRTSGGNKDVPFLLSATSEDPAIIAFFVGEYSVDINQSVEIDASFRETTFALISAIKALNTPVVEWILKNGGRTDVLDGKGWSCLHHAAAMMDYSVAKVVVASSKSHIDAENSDGNTPLHIAAKAGHVEMVRLLVEEGGASVVRARSFDDMAVVHVAAKEGHSHLVDMLCTRYGVNPKAQFKCRSGKSYILRCPIHLAALEGNFTTLETLLKYCEPNTLDSSGNTPLHCCFNRKYDASTMKPMDHYEDCVKLLLNKDCDLAIVNSQGDSVYELAERNGYEKMMEMLRNPRRSYTLKSYKMPKRVSQENKAVVVDATMKKDESADVKAAENEGKTSKLIKKKSSRKVKSQEEEDIPTNKVTRKTSRKTSFKNKLMKFENIAGEEKEEEANLTEWLEEQAQLLKSKNENEKTIPVAQSTPPPARKFEKTWKETTEVPNGVKTKKERPPPPPKPSKKPQIRKGTVFKSSESQETGSSDDQSLDLKDPPRPVPRPRPRNSVENELSPIKAPAQKVKNIEPEPQIARSPKKFNKSMGVPVFPTAYRDNVFDETSESKSPSPNLAKSSKKREVEAKAPVRVDRKVRQNGKISEQNDEEKEVKSKLKVLPDTKKVALKPPQNNIKKPAVEYEEKDDEDEDEDEDSEEEESEDSEDQRAMVKVLKKMNGDQHESDEDEEEDDEESSYEDEEEEEEEEEVDTEVIVMTETSPVFKPSRTRAVEVLRNNEGKFGFSIIGGNQDGIFIHTVQKHSSGHLKPGEQLIEVNGRAITGKTKDDMYKLLETLTLNSEKVALVLSDERMSVYQELVKNGGSGGDRFYVKAKFGFDGNKKKELSVREGDVFCVLDSLPDKHDACWKAQKMTTTFRRSEDMNVGLIPNRQRADQLALKQHLSSSGGSRNGTFMRSFRRAKSAEKLSQKNKLNESADFNTSLTIVGYERVCQAAPSKRKRPVIVLGLFCDVVIDMLVQNSPNLFFRPQFSLENSNTDFDDSPIDTESMQRLMNEPENAEKRHLISIMNPATIDYMRKKTYIDPIVVFISPVSKSIVKNVKNQLAPQFNKSVSHLFEEASKFERAYSHLFSSIVSYTPDEWWFFHLKEAITYCQQQGLWLPEDVAFVAQKKKLVTSSTSGFKQESPKKILSKTMDNIIFKEDNKAKKSSPRDQEGLPPKPAAHSQNSLPLPPRRTEPVASVKKAVLPPPPSKKANVSVSGKNLKDESDEDDEADDDDEEGESEEEEDEEDEQSEEEERPVEVAPKKSVRAVKQGAVNGKRSKSESRSQPSNKPPAKANEDQRKPSNHLKELNSPLVIASNQPLPSNQPRKMSMKTARMNSVQGDSATSENERPNAHNKLVFKKSSNIPSRETPL